MSDHTGETEAVYSVGVARLATKIIHCLSAGDDGSVSGAIFGIVRLAEAVENHQLCWRAIEEKMAAFKIAKESIGVFKKVLERGENLQGLVEYIHPTLQDSKYMYRFIF